MDLVRESSPRKSIDGKKHFGEGVNTESYTWPIKEWSRIVDICIKEEKTLDELLGEEYDPEADE